MQISKQALISDLYQKAASAFQKRDTSGLYLYAPIQEGFPQGLVLDFNYPISSFIRPSQAQFVVQFMRGNIPKQPMQQPQAAPAGAIDQTSTLQKKPKILQYLTNFFTARPTQEDLIKKKVLQGEVHTEKSTQLRYDIIARCLQFIEMHGRT